MKVAGVVLAAVFCVGMQAPLGAQEIKFPASFEKLAARASEAVDVTLDSSMLQLASKFMDKSDGEKARSLVSGLKGVWVRAFEFDKEGEYSPSDLADLRNQITNTPGWVRIVGVTGKRETAEVFLKQEGERVGGLTVIATEPKELVVVHILGNIRLEDLEDLGGNFGIPRMRLSDKVKVKTK
jgi:hypothetical protein